MMKEIISKIILLLLDAMAISIAILLAFQFREIFSEYFVNTHYPSLDDYLNFWFLYLVIFVVFIYEGIYSSRFDFWHEGRKVIKGLAFAFLIIMAYLAMTRSIENFSRVVIVMSFVFMTFFIPLLKNLGKKKLFHMGLWQREAKIYGNDAFIKDEVFNNPYLGYVDACKSDPKTVFINSRGISNSELNGIIEREISNKHEVIFIPLINKYNLTQSQVYELSNIRINLIVLQNRLKSHYRIILQQTFNYSLAIALFPILIPVIAVVAILIKKESPGPVFFTHNRVAKDGKIIPTLKFRSMYKDAKERLAKLLEDDPIVKVEWEKNFKLKDDPRITKIGKFLRKTSLDELPQIFNVLKGEMNFVGPRPVIQEEIDTYYKDDSKYYYMVKPGITGLWQVSGRSDTGYDFRVATDKWYVLNWSLWLDIVILLKTVKVVLKREGAY